MSDSEHSDASGDEEQPSEAELALKKRREANRQVSASGLDDEAKELLETNRQDRERMEEEIAELKKRNEKRKKEREVEEKRLAAERAADEERRKAADEAKRKQKEEEDAKRRKERDSKRDEFERLSKAGKPNFVITKRSDSTADEEPAEADAQPGKKSREQLEREKRAILKQRIVPLNADGLDQSGLADKAKELHKLLHRLESDKYDLEKRYKQQQVEMMELAERARQANRVGREGVKRVVLGEGENDLIQQRFAGAPAKIEMYSKYERQKDKRTYPERHTVYTGPQYIPPAAKIQPTRIIKWGEGGLPVYEDIEGAGGEGGEHGH
jgi:hypothetical protein